MRSPTTLGLALSLTIFMISCTNIQNQEVPSTLLIENVILIDGTGSNRQITDVRIVGNQIDAIGNLDPDNEEIIDGTGLVLSPGFIDTHSHHDRNLLENPDALALLSQGVTTIIVGQDGGSNLPVVELKEALWITPTSVNL
ncbi:uncharacterized protein METZ01_LOCUS355994, partial [marine metagenome]